MFEQILSIAKIRNMENGEENIHVDIRALRVSIQFQPTVSRLKTMRIKEMIIRKRIACEKNFPFQYCKRSMEISMQNMIRRCKGFGSEAPSTVQHAHISQKTVTKMRDKKLFHTHIPYFPQLLRSYLYSY